MRNISILFTEISDDQVLSIFALAGCDPNGLLSHEKDLVSTVKGKLIPTKELERIFGDNWMIRRNIFHVVYVNEFLNNVEISCELRDGLLRIDLSLNATDAFKVRWATYCKAHRIPVIHL